MIGLAAVILGLGYFGPHRSTGASSSPSAPEATASPASSSGVSGPTQAASEALDALVGLDLVTPGAGQTTTTRLPGRIGSTSFHVIGSRLFYVVATDRIESSLIGSAADPQTLVTVPGCEAIDQLNAAANWLAYVVVTSADVVAAPSECVAPGKATWSIWLLDLRGGGPREIASGGRVPTAVDSAASPVHLALSDSAYAFDRPADPANPASGTTVEVHAISGRLLWSSNSHARVERLLLGGTELAVMTSASGASGASGAAGGAFDLSVSDASHPALRKVGRPASSASISPDGRYLSWDVRLVDGSNFGIEGVESGQIIFLFSPTTADLLAPPRPTIEATSRGPLVAWLATSREGTVYPAFLFPYRGGGLLESVQKPVWLDLQGNTLIWVVDSPDGTFATAFAVDLTTIALH